MWAPAPSIDDLANDVVALLDALKLERIRYVGLSIGGMIGQRLAAALSRAGRSARALRDGEPHRNARGLESAHRGRSRRRHGGDFKRRPRSLVYAGNPRRAERRNCRFPKYARTDARRRLHRSLRRDSRRRSRGRRCAHRLSHARRSGRRRSGDAAGRRLRATRRNPWRARAQVIAGAAHIVPAERPQEFADLVLPFLRASRPAGVS